MHSKEFEQILKEILLELEDKGRKITLKDEQRKAVKQLYGKKDLAVLPTSFRKGLIIQLLVLLENRNRNGHTQTASVLIICPLTSIINDQSFEVESMGLSACNLSEKLADLTEVEFGKMFICSEIGAKAFGDGSQDICKYKESNLGPVAGFYGSNFREESFFKLVRAVSRTMQNE